MWPHFSPLMWRQPPGEHPLYLLIVRVFFGFSEGYCTIRWRPGVGAGGRPANSLRKGYPVSFRVSHEYRDIQCVDLGESSPTPSHDEYRCSERGFLCGDLMIKIKISGPAVSRGGYVAWGNLQRDLHVPCARFLPLLSGRVRQCTFFFKFPGPVYFSRDFEQVEISFHI